MKMENGHQSVGLPVEGLSSQVANAVGELLRAQQELEARGKAVDEREHDVAQSERALDTRAAEIAARAAAIDRTTQDLRDREHALEKREREVAAREAQADGLTAREQEQRDREATLLLRENELARREAELMDVAAETERLAQREHAIARERATCEESAAAHARHEAELEARSAQLAQREQAFETVCDMLRSMTAALNEPTPENICKALDSTAKAKEVRPALTAAKETPVPFVELVDTPPADEGFACGAVQAEDEKEVDLSDLSEEERRRVGMLQQLGTASLTEILAAIREERSTFGPQFGRKKRRLGFLK
jgi:chromosome segregation ATPase